MTGTNAGCHTTSTQYYIDRRVLYDMFKEKDSTGNHVHPDLIRLALTKSSEVEPGLRELYNKIQPLMRAPRKHSKNSI